MRTPESLGSHTPPDRILERLGALLGEDALSRDGSEPEAPGTPVASPASPEEAAALLRRASEEGWRVLPVGAGTAPNGGPGTGQGVPDLLVSARRMGGIRQYEPADLTLEVGAGTLLADLDRELARHGQWLPLLPPGGGAVTLGGLVSVGHPGALAVAYGGPRDQLLGLTLADARGRALPLGGRVVKNVAGFDLVRLLCGSRGALGLICHVSFRLHPRPASDRTLIWTGDEVGSVFALGRDLARLPLPLAALEIHGHGGDEFPESARGPWAIVLRAVGSDPAVTRMVDSAVEVAGGPTLSLEAEASERFALASAAREGAATPQHRRTVAPTRLGDVLRRLALGGPQDDEPVKDSVVADLRSGALRRLGGSDQDLPPLPEVSPALRHLHGGIRQVFDPQGVLPGAWRYAWG